MSFGVAGPSIVLRLMRTSEQGEQSSLYMYIYLPYVRVKYVWQPTHLGPGYLLASLSTMLGVQGDIALNNQAPGACGTVSNHQYMAKI